MKAATTNVVLTTVNRLPCSVIPLDNNVSRERTTKARVKRQGGGVPPPLQDSWSWYWRGAKDRTLAATSSQYLAGLQEITTIRSIEEYNDQYPGIKPPCKLPRGDMYVFREGAQPAWENFPSGGCWILNLTERGASHVSRTYPTTFKFVDFNIIDGVWEEVIGAVVNERFGTPDLVGVTMSVRRANMFYKLMIWNRNKDPDAKEQIRKRLFEILYLPEDCGLEYKYFFDSLRSDPKKKKRRKWQQRKQNRSLSVLWDSASDSSSTGGSAPNSPRAPLSPRAKSYSPRLSPRSPRPGSLSPRAPHSPRGGYRDALLRPPLARSVSPRDNRDTTFGRFVQDTDLTGQLGDLQLS